MPCRLGILTRFKIHNSRSVVETVVKTCGYGFKGDDRKSNTCQGGRSIQKVISKEPGLLMIEPKTRKDQSLNNIVDICQLTSIDKIEHQLTINGST